MRGTEFSPVEKGCKFSPCGERVYKERVNIDVSTPLSSRCAKTSAHSCAPFRASKCTTILRRLKKFGQFFFRSARSYRDSKTSQLIPFANFPSTSIHFPSIDPMYRVPFMHYKLKYTSVLMDSSSSVHQST